MKICALRVASCGRFDSPVAIEGFSGGLDVMVGPNELGKSTLLRALKAALFERHTTRKAEIEALRPYGGGAPLIEVDFEIAGRRWRLRKQFLAERTAELAALGGGSVARGADAESELERLLGVGNGAARFPLLWLDQGGTLAEAAPGEKAGEILRSAISREVSSAAGGDRARRLKARVQAVLAELVTPGRGQKRGRYLAAQREVEACEAGLAKAQQALAGVEDLLGRLGHLDEQARLAGDAAVRSARLRRIADAEAHLAEARESIASRDRARLAVAETRATHDTAAAVARTYCESLDEVVRLAAEAAADEAAADALGTDLPTAAAACAGLEQQLEAGRRDLAAAEAELAAVRTRQRHQELSERCQRAEAANRRAGELRLSLGGLPASDGPIREARRLASRIGEAEARLEARSAAVTISYVAGGEGRIRLAGRAVGQGERIVADAPLELEIEGVGRVTIAPGTAPDQAVLRDGLAADRRALTSILAASGGGDVAALEARHQQARQVMAELSEAEAHLSALAPLGLDRLADELAALGPASHGDTMRLPLPEEASVKAAIERLRGNVAALAGLLSVRRVEVERMGRDEAARTARTNERARRLSALEAGLPPVPDREAKRLASELAAATASRAYDEALRLLSAWEGRAPDATGFTRLEADLMAARDAVMRADRDEAALAAERARVEGALESAQREDVAAETAFTEAAAIRARANLADIAEEVAALQLLDSELAAEEARLTSLYVEPVTSRLAPYLEVVLPDAAIELGDGYRVAAVARGGRSEALAQLSDGTREQIAVIVRLGFARLLADQGMAVPLVLDDALVYSDDARIASMHRALEMAALAHQVIVLTCREQSFAGLAGHRLRLASWQPRS